MSNKTTIHIVRHGEVFNPKKVLYGRLSGYHLSSRGKMQAKASADWLANKDIVYIASSPLERAKETSESIAKIHNLQITIDADLNESWNKFEGEIVNSSSQILLNPRNWLKLINPMKPSWGEPYEKIALRMISAMHRAIKSSLGHEAVCVSHQLPVEILRRAVTGCEFAHLPLKYNRLCNLSSITSFTFVEDKLIRWGYTEPWGI